MTSHSLPATSARFWNLPNILTISRILLILPFMFFMYAEFARPESYANVWAFAIFILAAITDWIDGVVARRWNAVTPLGMLFDPLADKLLVTSALVMLAVFHAMEGGIVGAPAWIAVIIIARELAVTGLRGMASAEGVVISASSGGKLKMIAQMVALGGLILQGARVEGGRFELVGLTLDAGLVGYIALWVALLLTLWSGLVYFYRFLGKLA